MKELTRQQMSIAILLVLLGITAGVGYHERQRSNVARVQVGEMVLRSEGKLHDHLVRVQYILTGVAGGTRPVGDLREAGLALEAAEGVLNIMSETAPQYAWGSVQTTLTLGASDLIHLSSQHSLTEENRAQLGDLLHLVQDLQRVFPAVSGPPDWRVQWDDAAVRTAGQYAALVRRPPRRLGDVPTLADLYAARLVDNSGKSPDRPLDQSSAQKVLDWLAAGVITQGATDLPQGAWALALELKAGRMMLYPEVVCTHPIADPHGAPLQPCQAVIVDVPGQSPAVLKAPDLAHWIAETQSRPEAVVARPIAHLFNTKAGLDRWLDSAFPLGQAELEQIDRWLEAAQPLSDPQLRTFPIGVPGGLPYLKRMHLQGDPTSVELAYRCTSADPRGCALEPDVVLVDELPFRSSALARYLAPG